MKVDERREGELGGRERERKRSATSGNENGGGNGIATRGESQRLVWQAARQTALELESLRGLSIWVEELFGSRDGRWLVGGARGSGRKREEEGRSGKKLRGF